MAQPLPPKTACVERNDALRACFRSPDLSHLHTSFTHPPLSPSFLLPTGHCPALSRGLIVITVGSFDLHQWPRHLETRTRPRVHLYSQPSSLLLHLLPKHGVRRALASPRLVATWASSESRSRSHKTTIDSQNLRPNQRAVARVVEALPKAFLTLKSLS